MRHFVLGAGVAAAIFSFAAAAEATIIDLDHRGPVNHLLSLEAGTYQITPVGISEGGAFDALNVWGLVEGCDVWGENCLRGWQWRYQLVDELNQIVSSAFFGLFSGSLDALAAAKAAGPFQFTLSSNQDVRFVYTGRLYHHNRGGISFDLTRVETPAEPTDVPEPATLALLGAGLLGIAALRRRREI
ncbi:PEP-CTERM sorting domain-containing protein [Rhodospirillaceae bacterium SYSU D60014]|uniref:PEP-CTERM sorting domain-containing protein n=1 Tax=Virgifigura deserti TaxID=2268457 RepID=UPI000E66DCC3